MNSKVNNWVVELEQFRLHLEWIPGSQNLLVDSLSHLLDVVPDATQPDETKNHEFGSYCFEELEPVLKRVSTEVIELQTVMSEGVECSLKSRKSPEVEGIVLNYKQEPQEQQPQARDSESSKPFQNSRISSEERTCERRYEEKPLNKHDLFDGSESREHLWNSRKDSCVKITEHEDLKEITLSLKPRQLQELQKNNTYCRDIAKKLYKDVELQKIFIKEKGVLYRLWIEDGRTFKCILVPKVLQDSMMILEHDYSGHNRSRRTYNCLKKQYYTVLAGYQEVSL